MVIMVSIEKNMARAARSQATIRPHCRKLAARSLSVLIVRDQHKNPARGGRYLTENHHEDDTCTRVDERVEPI